jgi:hypothetical protein
MGQQQLLLLVLAAVIVGTAVVLGINMFSQNASQANQDAVMQDMMTIVSKAQAWFARPAEMGGGGRTFTALTDAAGWGLLNFPKTNANGTYTLTPAAKTITIGGAGVEGTWTVSVVADSGKVVSSTITP